MRPPFHGRGARAAPRPQASDDEDEDDSNLEPAKSDDIVKPPGIENGPTPPFGVLCMLFDQLESATRNKHKKVGYKGELLGQFISVRTTGISVQLWDRSRLTLGPAALEGRSGTGPLPPRPPDAARGAFPFSFSRFTRHSNDLTSQRDTRRRTYNLKEQKLAKAIIQALGLPQKNSTALKLINWKVPTKEDVRSYFSSLTEHRSHLVNSPAQESLRAFTRFLACLRHVHPLSHSSVAYDVIKSRSTVIRAVSDVTIDDVNDTLEELSHTRGGTNEANGQKTSMQ